MRLEERAIVFGRESNLIGVLTKPTAEREAGANVAVIVLNAGLLHHVGPNRISVAIARRLAELGFPVLRFDFSGIGDSSPRSDRSPFAESAMTDVSEAMEWLQAETRAERFILTGICSGADISFRAAIADERVAGVALMNAQGYELDTSDEVHADVKQRKDLRYYLTDALFNPRSWKKVLTGKSDYLDIGRLVGGRLRSKLAGESLPESERLVGELRSLLDRGTRLLILYSEGDTGLDYLRTNVGSQLPQLQAHPGMELDVLRHTDHVFTPRKTRNELLERVIKWMEFLDWRAGDDSSELPAAAEILANGRTR